jgi:hypothetical protein
VKITPSTPRIIGAAALRAMKQASRHIIQPAMSASAIRGGKRIQLALPSSHWKTWTDQGGLDCRDGGYSERRRGGQAPRAIVLHWGGLDVRHCLRALVSRGLSSHGGVGPDAVYQWLDLAHRAYHAGTPANDWSVGLDICQSPRPEFIDETRARGFRVQIADNPTDRGPSEIVTLDPRIAGQVRRAVPALCLALGIPARVPRGPDGLQSSGEVYHGVVDVEAFLAGGGGVLGHHHLRKTKWDYACWADDIFGGTALG